MLVTADQFGRNAEACFLADEDPLKILGRDTRNGNSNDRAEGYQQRLVQRMGVLDRYSYSSNSNTKFEW